jgi:hypothetical protein
MPLDRTSVLVAAGHEVAVARFQLAPTALLHLVPGSSVTCAILHRPPAASPAPPARSFVTGGEDGYVRVHHFDMDYFTTKFF